MSLATNTALAVFVLTTIYVALFVGVIPTPEPIYSKIIPLLPWWSLVAFGAYALGTLGYDIVTFKDKEDKYKELLGEIDEAKRFLRTNGVDVD